MMGVQDRKTDRNRLKDSQRNPFIQRQKTHRQTETNKETVIQTIRKHSNRDTESDTYRKTKTGREKRTDKQALTQTGIE